MASKKALQVVPTDHDYVLQAHAISRAAYELPVMQRRLLHLVMAQVQITGEELKPVEMTVGDVVRALGLSDAGPRYEEIRAACRGLCSRTLDVDEPDGWVVFPWVDSARYIKSRDALQVKLSDELHPFVLNVKDMFRIIPIRDMTLLQGKYSYRIFELVMADRGFEGKGGNRQGEWFTDLDFGDLRTLLKIKPTEYKMTKDFRVRVIDGPVREINEAGMGLRIDCDYQTFRRGRSLLGVRLKCKLQRRDDPRTVSPATKAEEEEDALIELNQELFDRLLAEEPKDIFGVEFARRARAYAALKKHPKVKHLPKPKGKKSKS
jgi:hypothetical protein